MDKVNSFFELFGGLFILPSIIKAWKAGMIVGVHWTMPLFFWTWGAWNLIYYPHLDQWWSFAAGLVIWAANSVWLFMVFKYAD